MQACRNLTDYRLGAITKSCLNGATGAAIVQELCGKLKDAVAKRETSAFYHDDFLNGLFSAQPTAAVDGLCAGDEKALRLGMRILNEVRSRKNLVALVPEDEILRWCDQEPKTRYAAMARLITISQRTSKDGPLHWTSLALRFLKKAPDPGEILKEFVSQFVPADGWSGSFAAILEAHATLLDDLAAYPDLGVFVAQEKVRLQQVIERHRRSETASDRQRDERFE